MSQPGKLVGNSLVGTCVTLPNLGFLWVFFKYPKISNNWNLLCFPVVHSEVLFSQRFFRRPPSSPSLAYTVPCRIFLASPADLDSCPNHFNLCFFLLWLRYHRRALWLAWFYLWLHRYGCGLCMWQHFCSNKIANRWSRLRNGLNLLKHQ